MLSGPVLEIFYAPDWKSPSVNSQKPCLARFNQTLICLESKSHYLKITIECENNLTLSLCKATQSICTIRGVFYLLGHKTSLPKFLIFCGCSEGFMSPPQVRPDQPSASLHSWLRWTVAVVGAGCQFVGQNYNLDTEMSCGADVIHYGSVPDGKHDDVSSVKLRFGVYASDIFSEIKIVLALYNWKCNIISRIYHKV